MNKEETGGVNGGQGKPGEVGRTGKQGRNIRIKTKKRSHNAMRMERICLVLACRAAHNVFTYARIFYIAQGNSTLNIVLLLFVLQ